LRKASSLLDDEARSELLVFLGMNPESGTIIPETGGVRKLRWTVPGRGSEVACGLSTITAMRSCLCSF
jgi:hypothetical protein